MIPLAAFPKAYMDELVLTRQMTIFEWIDMAATLQVDGLEMYPGFFTSMDEAYLADVKRRMDDYRLAMPMLCASPDFTHPDPVERQRAVQTYRSWIDLTAFFGGTTCRVLSGQRHPDVSRSDGVSWVVECINEVLPYAAERGVILAMENHYKDGFWRYHEFAQHL